MFRNLTLILTVAVVTAGLASSAGGAATSDTAAYYGYDAFSGNLTVAAVPNSKVVIYDEQCDGLMLPVAGGVVGMDGTLSIDVPHLGPTQDGLPQYQIEVHHPTGDVAVILAGGPGDDDRWWLD